METNENLTPQPVLNLDEAGIRHLKETRQWAGFISIVGFVFIGIMIVSALAIPSFGGAMVTDFPFGGMWVFFTIIMLILVVLWFFPVYYLFTFSRYSKLAIANNDAVAFNEAMRFLKKHYRFMGILMIIFLSFYILAALIGVMAGSLIGTFR